ncbi:MAG TPA: carbohydrate kinase family protein [Gudongella oleilytica]|nr:carbohydrate kinase family protein [Gudongella oleilytica]
MIDLNASLGAVAVIGGANLDIVGSPSKILIRGDSNIGSVKLSPGGVGRNIAENTALLGIPTRLFSIVGNDSFGDYLLTEAKKSGIDVDFVKRVSSPTGIYLAILDENKDMDLAINAMEIMAELDWEYISDNKASIEKSEIIVLDANLKKNVLERVTNEFRHKKLFLDTVSTAKSESAASIIGSFHTIKPNKIEAETLTGIRIHSRDDLLKAANIFHDRGVLNVCITLGKDGVFYSAKDGEHGGYRSTEFVPLNATGAGDAFQAGLIYGELNGFPLKDSIRYAMGAAIVAMSSEDTISKEMSIGKITTISKRLEEIK